MIYILIGLLLELSLEVYMLVNGSSLIELMNSVLQEKQHEELKKDWKIGSLHFMFAGTIIFFWPIYLLLLLVKP